MTAWDGGIYPLWSRDGGALFYLQPGDLLRLMRVTVESAQGTFSFRDRRMVMEWP